MGQYGTSYYPSSGFSLVMHHCGIEENATPNGFGPIKRDHYLIHCVLKGSGYFENEGVRYHVRAGEAFLIRPYEVAFYISDKEDPWTYAWVGFSGSEANDILEMMGGGPILQITDPAGAERCVARLIRLRSLETNPFARLGELYHFFSYFVLSPGSAKILSPVAVAQMFFQQNHTCAITVEQAADYAGVSRSHLFRLFRQTCSISPQEYLCRLRLQHAAQLLQSGSPVAQAAYSAGFTDLPNFSRRFKKSYGVTPSKYAADAQAPAEPVACIAVEGTLFRPSADDLKNSPNPSCCSTVR